jgi:hypothetical protein
VSTGGMSVNEGMEGNSYNLFYGTAPPLRIYLFVVYLVIMSVLLVLLALQPFVGFGFLRQFTRLSLQLRPTPNLEGQSQEFIPLRAV